MAHWEGTYTPNSYQSYCDTIYGYYHNHTTFYKAYGSTVAHGGTNATNSDVINYINQGMHIVNYRGHGSAYYWGNPNWNESNETFYYSGVNNLNSNTNAVFFSVSCNTGNITVSNNMLEAFMRSSRGASAFVGSTSSSYTIPNNYYNVKLYHELYDKGMYQLGDINMKAHVLNIQTYSTSPFYTGHAIDDAFSYICGGDPALEIWTNNPQPVPNVGITSSGDSVTVSTGLSNGYHVYVSSLDGELVDSLWVTSSSITFAKPDDKFYFSVSKHDYIPFVVYCDSEANTLQNVNVTENRFYDNTPFAAGENVDSGSIGDVIVNSGSTLFIQKGSGGVLLDNGFKCETGAGLEVK